MPQKIINVVAAAILKDGKYFCAQRPEGKSLSGYWEFPGGKLEAGESPERALIREIKICPLTPRAAKSANCALIIEIPDCVTKATEK
ncbi:NUDIX domain-containing protein [Streptococcus gallolyticus]|nr:NUDIX domain-containing protein [Streptococcus gallolyticus]MBY5042037.1 NUDIX domain-containing protein [Streptococcus gallolyticus]